MNYIDVTKVHVPGIIVQDGKPFGMVDGVQYPVIGVLRDGRGGYVPVLDIPQMTDEQLKEQARRHPVRKEAVA